MLNFRTFWTFFLFFVIFSLRDEVGRNYPLKIFSNDSIHLPCVGVVNAAKGEDEVSATENASKVSGNFTSDSANEEEADLTLLGDDAPSGSPSDDTKHADDMRSQRLHALVEGLEYKYGENGKQQNYKKALEILESLVSGDDPLSAQALYEIGDMYLYGSKGFTGLKRNLKLAVSFFNQAAACGNGPALHMTSFALSSSLGNLFEQNEKIATRLEYFATMTDYIPSIMGMGFRFFYGDGVSKSCKLALKHYKFAAEMALQSEYSTTAMPLRDDERLDSNTAKRLAEMDEISNQKDDIVQYWEKEASGGRALAQYELAKMYEDDNVDLEKAAALYQLAADQGLSVALRDLGLAFLQGAGVEKDVKRGMEYLQQAADYGDPEAQNYMAYIYLFGDEEEFGHTKSFSKAVDYFTKAALQDFPEALFLLGELKRKAFSSSSEPPTEQDYRIALRLYQRAADYRYIKAFWRIGQLYELGQGCEQSCEAATLAYKIVAESGPWANDVRNGMRYYAEGDLEGALISYSLYGVEGYEIAQNNAAWLYKNEKGCKGKDCYTKALQMYMKSSMQGNNTSFMEIADLYLNGRGNVEKNSELGLAYLKKALQEGDSRALLPMAKLYETGAPTIERDLGKALLCLEAEASNIMQGKSDYLVPSSSSPLRKTLSKMLKYSLIQMKMTILRLKLKLSRSKPAPSPKAATE